MNSLKNKTVLLDICCANCATVCIERLKEQGAIVIGMFINDNIHPEAEYQRRKGDALRIAKHYDIELIIPEYRPQDWFDYIKGFEAEPERGERCSKCFEYRFIKTYECLQKYAYDYFTTTLTISPHKRSKVINAIGESIAPNNFLSMDFKKKSGYQLSLACSKELELYRQKYCGCVFSKESREEGIKNAPLIDDYKRKVYNKKRNEKRDNISWIKKRKETFLYNTFNEYLTKKYEAVVRRLPIDAGFSCPNLDGTISTNGCSYCDNKTFNSLAGEKLSIEEQIERMIRSTKERFGAEKFIAYFQNYSNTHADLDILEEIYSKIHNYDDIVALAVSTRPDCVDDDKLKLLSSFTKNYDVFLEYGLQSMHDKTLVRINRGHDFECFKEAVIKSHQNGLKAAAHVILGLPGESKEDMLATAEEIAKLPLWGIKFHALHISKDTPMAKQYEEEPFKLLSKEEYVEICAEFLMRIPKEWIVLRLVSDANEECLVGPDWMQDKHDVQRDIDKYMMENGFYQGMKYGDSSSTC